MALLISLKEDKLQQSIGPFPQSVYLSVPFYQPEVCVTSPEIQLKQWWSYKQEAEGLSGFRKRQTSFQGPSDTTQNTQLKSSAPIRRQALFTNWTRSSSTSWPNEWKFTTRFKWTFQGPLYLSWKRIHEQDPCRSTVFSAV